MTTALKSCLARDNFKLSNLIGIGVDGANAMVGAHNSVSLILSKEIPHLITVKCVWHSLHLCAELACDVLPKNLDFLVKESYTWFSRSTQRNLGYQKLYDALCEGFHIRFQALWNAMASAITMH